MARRGWSEMAVEDMEQAQIKAVIFGCPGCGCEIKEDPEPLIDYESIICDECGMESIRCDSI